MKINYSECMKRKCEQCKYYKSCFKKDKEEGNEMFKINDRLKFTGHDYNIAKIFNYEEIFKDKELIIENILKCPCEDGKNDKIKFKGIEGYYRSIFFDKEEKYEKSIRSNE